MKSIAIKAIPNSEEKLMTSKDVMDFYVQMKERDIKIWIDGGWSVDALLGKELRLHRDLDIAIQWRDVPVLREVLAAQGYEQAREDNQWNFVLADDKGHEIDVHAFIYDSQGNVTEGIMYSAESLVGIGTINGHTVRCISPKYMVEFLAPWIQKWPEKYLEAVFELCKKFDIKLPTAYVDFKKSE